MNKISTIITVILLFTSTAFAGEVYTDKQVDKILQKSFKIDTEKIILMDEIYEAYPLARALQKADSTNHFYKSNLYDCEDVAKSVEAIVKRHITELNDSGGAVMFGIIMVSASDDEEKGHVLNVFITDEKKAYVYDYQEITDGKTIMSVKDYLKTNVEIGIIII